MPDQTALVLCSLCKILIAKESYAMGALSKSNYILALQAINDAVDDYLDVAMDLSKKEGDLIHASDKRPAADVSKEPS